MKPIPLILFLLFLAAPALAIKQAHLPLLAVKEVDSRLEGSNADLYLEIKEEGEGRVFLETFPLTKSDTQISVRFAKEIACNYAEIDCSSYDFIYTIKADSAIVGGPSAGAAAALVAISKLKDTQLDQTATMTGTINAGGLIGPVGGIKEKVDAAAQRNLKKVLIPKGERFLQKPLTLSFGKNETANATVDIVEYGKTKGIEIIEVATLNDAFYAFTGKKLREEDATLTVDSAYGDTMKHLAVSLCNRTKELQKNMPVLFTSEFNASKTLGSNLSDQGKAAFEAGNYYSSASYCFGANVRYSYLILQSQNITQEELLSKGKALAEGIVAFNTRLEKEEIKTITDLEAYMIVKERLTEAQDSLNASTASNDTKNSIYHLAYATERLNSADSWFIFFDHRGKQFDFNRDNLKSSCQSKITEAEERYEYVKLFLPAALQDTRKAIDYAYQDLSNGNYELCLFKASKSKAEADIILGTMGVNENQVDDILNEKLKIVRMNIASETRKDIFPVVGYSYYEYATSLRQSDKFSALLFAEYALELSNLDIYFSPAKKQKEEQQKETLQKDNPIVGLAIGFAVGLFVGLLIKKGIRNKANTPKTKSKSKKR